jgi:hypothetical protein
LKENGMPRFFFQLSDGQLDSKGRYCATPQEGMAFAAQLAAQFGRNHEHIAPDLRVYVTDEMGREVFTMPVRGYAQSGA